MDTRTDPVRAQSPAVAEMAADWAVIDALMGGTRAMRAVGKAYLPQWPAEGVDDYTMRLATATLFPAYARTVSVLASKPFSKPITVGEDVPARISGLFFDVDRQGRNLDAFTAGIAHNALSHGLCGILVDCPPGPKPTGRAPTVAEERAQGIRPYWVHVRPQSVLGWRAVQVSGARVVTQLRLLECVEEPDGEFAEKAVEQVRVLEPGLWTIWRKRIVEGAGEKWVPVDGGTTSLDFVPFVPVYGMRKGFMTGAAPMLELAHANVAHWQSQSDQQTILHYARVPLLFGKGLGDSPIVAKANGLIVASDPGADLKFVEHSGQAIEAGRKSLLDLEDRMRQIGAELLVVKPANTSVTQTVADDEPGMCDLQRIVLATQDAINTALDYTAKWIGEPKGGTVKLFNDFGVASLAEASAALLMDGAKFGKISHATLLNELKRRGVLSPEVDVEKEAAAAKAEAPEPDADQRGGKGDKDVDN